MPRIKSRSSRRVPPLKDSDYDHEIHLVDDATTAAQDDDGDGDEDTGAAVGTAGRTTVVEIVGATGGPAVTRVSSASNAALLAVPTSTSTGAAAAQHDASSEPGRGRRSADAATDTSAEARPGPHPASSPGRPSKPSLREPVSVMEVLYENERGGFLCGMALFSRAALGNTDPPPWTNAAHRPSRTDIYTAQLPDPSWYWAWPEWRVNHDEGTDADGWEYSFMFSDRFSWHGPSWYNSFVRRRAWIRKRTKRGPGSAGVSSAAASAVSLGGGGRGSMDDGERVSDAYTTNTSAMDPRFLNPEYFTVLPAAAARRSSSRASSRMGSRTSIGGASIGGASIGGASIGQAPRTSMDVGTDTGTGTGTGTAAENGLLDQDGFPVPDDIYNADVLMAVLRRARNDREKIVAVDSFLEHAGEDLVRLQDVMHEIMSLFVFQASRRTLLTLLKTAYDGALDARRRATEAAEATDATGSEAENANGSGAGTEKGKQKAAEAMDTAHQLQALGRRSGYMAAAVRHADEEVRRLEYWSDVRAMAQKGKQKGTQASGQAGETEGEEKGQAGENKGEEKGQAGENKGEEKGQAGENKGEEKEDKDRHKDVACK